MAKHGLLFEIDSMIPTSQIRGAIATTDVDGGQPVVLAGKHAKEKTLFNAELYTAGKSVHIAYNPSRVYEKGADGQLRPTRVIDKRYYTNIANMGFTTFKPEVGMYFGITLANITGDVAPTVGQFVEPTVGTALYTIAATQTADVPSFEVIEIKSIEIPTGDFTESEEPVYVVQCVHN